MNELQELKRRIENLERQLAGQSLPAGIQINPGLVTLRKPTWVNGTLSVVGSLAAPSISVTDWAWAVFTSTLTGPGGSAGTYAETNSCSRYCRIGNVVFLRVWKKIVDKGSWTGNVQMLLPVDAINGNGVQASPAWYALGTIAAKANCYSLTGENLLFSKAIGSAMYTWADVVVNDWLALDYFYEVA